MASDDAGKPSESAGVVLRQTATGPVGATLRDGTRVVLRAADANDTERLRAFQAGLSRETRRARFLTASTPTPRALDPCCECEAAAMMLVAALATENAPARDSGPLLGVAHYEPIAGGEAEVALVVADGYQRRGIGALLIEQLAVHAVERGVFTAVADVMSANTRVLAMIRRAAIPVTSGGSAGELRLRFDLRARTGRER